MRISRLFRVVAEADGATGFPLRQGLRRKTEYLGRDWPDQAWSPGRKAARLRAWASNAFYDLIGRDTAVAGHGKACPS